MGHRIRLLSVSIAAFANSGADWDMLTVWLKIGIGVPPNLDTIQRWQDVLQLRGVGGGNNLRISGHSGSISFTCGNAYEGMFSRLGAIVHKDAGADWHVNVLFEISEF